MRLAPQETRTFFVTTSTYGRRRLFQADRFARLFLELLNIDRGKQRYQLHEFVVMPEHIHLIITPASEVSLEKAIQFIKGGFSYRAKKELGFKYEVWQSGYNSHNIQDPADYANHVEYIRENPVRAGLVGKAEDYPYSSGANLITTDPPPPRLKPRALRTSTPA